MEYNNIVFDKLYSDNPEEYLKIAKKTIKNADNNKIIFQVANDLFFHLYFDEAKKAFRTLFNCTYYQKSIYRLAQIEKFNDNLNKSRDYYNRLFGTKIENIAMNGLGDLEFFTGNPKQAASYYLTNLNKEQNYHALNWLGRTYLSLEKYDEAEYLFNEFNKGRNYKNAQITSYLNAISLYIKKTDYEKSLHILESSADLYTEISSDLKHYIENCRFYLHYMLNQLDDKDCEDLECRYHKNQILNYDLDSLKSHINRHLEEKKYEIKHSIFNDDTNIDNLIVYSQEAIKNKSFWVSSYSDNYIIKFDNAIGKSFRHDTPYVQVSTIPNTKNITSIFPILPMTKKEANNFTRQRIK